MSRMDGDFSVSICCLDWHRFDESSEQDAWSQFDFLAASHGTARAGDFAAYEMARGSVYDADCLLADESLRDYVGPVSGILHDWMHVYLQHGVASAELHLFCECLRRLGFRYQHLRDCCNEINWS